MAAMFSFRRECGLTHSSLCALLALRSRVRKSLIGSVMLPGRFDDAGDLPGEGELAELDARDAIFAVIGARAAAHGAAVADAHAGGIAGEFLELLLGGEELLVGRGRVGQDRLQLGAAGRM